jgi:anti-sigma B factor antagonist
MKVQTSSEDHHYLIGISGDLDASSSIVLDNAFAGALATRPHDILIDCTELNYISSPGIGVFISRLGDCEAQGVQMGLFGISDKILNVFKILGLDQLILIRKTKEEAKSAINGTQPTNRM